MISLKKRLSLTYAVFISIALIVLTLIINRFTVVMFSSLVRDNIRERSEEIVRTISGQYNPDTGEFDILSLEATGMHFTHEGYIVSIMDNQGGIVWDARSCDMQQCVAVMRTISDRMENRFQFKGAIQTSIYPISYWGGTVGTINIETYGPIFYSETELQFISTLNRILLAAGAALTLVTVCLSIRFAGSIVRPILKAGEAARRIAGGDFSVRINDGYKTRELHELSSSVNELAMELEENERRQKQLTSDIAHELRTPLTCLQGNIEAMIDGIWQPTEERLESCHEEIIRLSKLVEDIDTLTALEWDNMVLERTDFDLARLALLVAEQFIPAARQKGLRIILDLKPSPLNADYNRIKQVIINLLSNALKYTASGTITLRTAPAPGRTELSVSDTGIGIAGEALPHIFERFYRADKSRSRNTGGAGIGLTIAAAIVKAHGGKIEAESEPGKGSVFRIVL
ncbi:MAG: HAMP domain-containing histidine kinase [Treponema sp.]|jgi:signal transduction histidine kinase|nr:HAMP domain-containing histidine kinase [Treponema sp.]